MLVRLLGLVLLYVGVESLAVDLVIVVAVPGCLVGASAPSEVEIDDSHSGQVTVEAVHWM